MKNKIKIKYKYNTKRKKKKKKKKREGIFPNRGGGLTPIPYLFYFLFCKGMYKNMLSDCAFMFAFRVQNNHQIPKNSLENYSI